MARIETTRVLMIAVRKYSDEHCCNEPIFCTVRRISRTHTDAIISKSRVINIFFNSHEILDLLTPNYLLVIVSSSCISPRLTLKVCLTFQSSHFFLLGGGGGGWLLCLCREAPAVMISEIFDKQFLFYIEPKNYC